MSQPVWAMTPGEIINKIDYTLLDQQKQLLLTLADKATPEEAEACEGILNLMGIIQDCAEAAGLWTPKDDYPCEAAE
jgi:hypothetical protein